MLFASLYKLDGSQNVTSSEIFKLYAGVRVFYNVKFRDIDWEVSLVLSSRSVGVLDEPLVSVHLGDNKWVIIKFIRNIQSSKVCSEGKPFPWSLTRRSCLL